MRPPWDLGLGAADDAESLQTDVMRFVAILGLCLTAIFSLVNAAREEHLQSPAVALVASDTVAQAESHQATPLLSIGTERAADPTSNQAPDLAPEAVPESAPEPESEPESTLAGFTLAFSSEETLLSLRSLGAVQVYAMVGDEFWLLGEQGQLGKTNPPPSYYEMDEITLPPSILRAARNAGLERGLQWGVILPARTAAGIRALMASQTGGALVIEADQSVRLDRGVGLD